MTCVFPSGRAMKNSHHPDGSSGVIGEREGDERFDLESCKKSIVGMIGTRIAQVGSKAALEHFSAGTLRQVE